LETATASTLAGRDFPLGEPGFSYQDLHREDRLAELDSAFLEALAREDAGLAERLRHYRAAPDSVDPLARSRLLVDAARPLARFLARLFGIEEEWRRQASSAGPEAVLFRFRRDFLLRRAVKTKLPADLAGYAVGPVAAAAAGIERGLFPGLPWGADPELATSTMVSTLLDLESDFIAALRQKKKPEVPPASRESAGALARAAAAAPDPGVPRADGESDEELLAFLEATLEG
jgi:hypothetical protein